MHQPQPEMTAAQELAMEQAAAARASCKAEAFRRERVRGPRRPATGGPMDLLTVRLTRPVAAAVRREAEARGLADGALARAIIAERMGDAAQDAVPVRRYRESRTPPTVDVQEVAQLREAVGELGGTLRQLAGLTRRAGHAAMHEELEATLPRIRAVADALDHAKAALLSGGPQEGAQ